MLGPRAAVAGRGSPEEIDLDRLVARALVEQQEGHAAGAHRLGHTLDGALAGQQVPALLLPPALDPARQVDVVGVSERKRLSV